MTKQNVNQTIIRNVLEYYFVTFALTGREYDFARLINSIRAAKRLHFITEEEQDYLISATALLPCH